MRKIAIATIAAMVTTTTVAMATERTTGVYDLQRVTYAVDGKSYADVVDYDLTVTDCGMFLTFKPEPQIQANGAVVAFECVINPNAFVTTSTEE